MVPVLCPEKVEIFCLPILANIGMYLLLALGIRVRDLGAIRTQLEA